MNKKFKLFTIIGVALSSLLIACNAKSVAAYSPVQPMHRVDFFDNYQREEFVLSNGTKGKGNNLLYRTVEVEDGAFLTKPDDPYRKNYEFKGWFIEKECENEWNFTSDTVLSDLRLFAKWGYAEVQEDQEPTYYPPYNYLPADYSTSYEIISVMNFKVVDGVVKLSTSAINRLELVAAANDGHILDLIEYKIKPIVSSYDATYENKTITFKVNNIVQETIQVKDNSANWVVTSNTNYETKAKNYEAKIADENENYHVMLAGSSSIEFWTSSKEDLNPIVSYNHGIGGTTIEEWDEKLNQRLVFPYKPKMVVYYVGINNVINSKEDATTIWNKLEKFFNDTHEALPDTKVQYIMMNLIPGYTGYFGVINSVNAQVVEYQKTNTWLTLINPGTSLLKPNGQPNAAYFRTDGLHLSYYGYVVWGGIIKESIMKGLQND